MLRHTLLTLFLAVSTLLFAQDGYWQQSISYEMDVALNTNNHQVMGTQKVTYTNNSPDTLREMYYHLYFNAFQPGSMMDVRSRTIEDPDGRVGDRIGKLSPDEIGFQKVFTLKQDGKNVSFQTLGTLLKVELDRPILPGKSTVMEMEYQSQVPVQIRRSGRDNAEGISYSMTQWYPKVSEYDKDGWHPNPYIGREFYGVWGDFDVSITLDKSFVVGGTGLLKDETINVDGTKTWNFKAENVHDFAWAADPDYLHDVVEGPNGMEIHFYYENEEELKEKWTGVQENTVRLFEIMNETFGAYPYKKYSILQGGDGGMEYPMATLITGERSPGSLLGVIVHEVIHSWYQMVLATDEAQYAWMDEGFTTFASSHVMNILSDKNVLNPHTRSMSGYRRLVQSGKQEPLRTHADHFHTNFAYGVSSYSKGEIFLWQLRYMLGDDAFYPAMREYYNTWKFKHPRPEDVIRIMEKHGNCVLDWYLDGWINTTNTIDYAVASVTENGNKTDITLERIGYMPMPLDVKVTYEDGSHEVFHISNYNLFKDNTKRSLNHPEFKGLNFSDMALKPWPWTHPEYRFTIPTKKSKITAVQIDPLEGMADVERDNNRYESNTAPVVFEGN